MRTTLVFLLLLFAIAVRPAAAQTFERHFHGQWARTQWTFLFHADGSWQRVSSGHFGQTVAEGTYRISGDTIRLLTGRENTSGTVNELYLLDSDSMLIDLDLRYDYAPVPREQTSFPAYSSQVRNVKYPQVDTHDPQAKKDLEEVLNLAFNAPELTKYFHFDRIEARQLIIADYYALNKEADVRIVSGTAPASFAPERDIREAFFITFEDINQNADNIRIKLRVHGEGVEVWFTFRKKDGQWTIADSSHWER